MADFFFTSSLVMVNLFVAIIVSDIEELKREGNIQEMVNKAHHIIHYENLLSCLHLLDDQEKLMICTHSICFNCKGIRVSQNVQLQVQNIIKRKNLARKR